MEDRRAGRSVIAGPAIVDGTLYWGAGHTHLALPMFTGNNKLYVFTLNGKYGWRQERVRARVAGTPLGPPECQCVPCTRT